MNQRVLIVDDSATARALFKICITSDTEFEVEQAGNWQDGLEKAKDGEYVFIVLDYNMPEKTGPELATMMREAGVQAPFVLMSANTQKAVIDEISSLGFSHVVEKPVSAEKISIMLENVL